MADEIVVYCVDSDVLIHVGRSYRPDRFPTIWEHLERLIREARLIAPDEVRAEIDRGDDWLVEWARSQHKLFVQLNQELVDEFRRVTSEFPRLVAEKRPGPHADAFVVALANLVNREQPSLLERRRCVVLTNERRAGPHKIPNACDFFGVEVVDWFTFMERENLQF